MTKHNNCESWVTFKDISNGVDPGISEPGARPRRPTCSILGVWGLFWCPFTNTLCFLYVIVRVVKKTTVKYMNVVQVKTNKTNPEKNVKRGGGDA